MVGASRRHRRVPITVRLDDAPSSDRSPSEVRASDATQRSTKSYYFYLFRTSLIRIVFLVWNTNSKRKQIDTYITVTCIYTLDHAYAKMCDRIETLR